MNAKLTLLFTKLVTLVTVAFTFLVGMVIPQRIDHLVDAPASQANVDASGAAGR